MSIYFDFSPSETIVNIRLALTYHPKITANKIEERRYNAFLYVLAGSYRYTFSGKEFTAEKNSLIYIPANSVPYKYYIEGRDEFAKSMQIEFELTDLKTRMPLSFSDEPILISNAPIYYIRKDMEALIKCYSTHPPLEVHSAYSHLYSLFSHISEDSRAESRAHLSVLPAIRAIGNDISTKMSSAELAALCSLSESQFRRNFKEATSRTPSEYRKELLLNTAKELLTLENFRIGEIAELLGFYDIYAFSHFFTSEVGLSPTKYIFETKKKQR